jgi:hypothetical protein
MRIMVIILAGALGAFALIVYLLFRRLRQLSWQLTQLRVERDCERILRVLKMGPEDAPTEKGDAQELYSVETPVRSKGHLALYLGGNVAAFLAAHRHQRHLATAAGTALFATAAVVAALITVPGTDLPGLPDDGPPGRHSPVQSAPARSPTDPPGSSSASPPDRRDSDEVDDGLTVAGSHLPSSVPSAATSPPPVLRTPSPSGASTSPAPSKSQSLTPPQTPAASSSSLLDLCVSVEALIDLDLCLGD